MSAITHFLWLNGAWGNPAVVNALWLGTVVAIVSGAVGVFTVLRGQGFAGHAVSDMGAAGAAGSLLAGLDIVSGFLGFSVIAGLCIDLLGVRPRERDVATGLVLTAFLGLGALFMYFDTRVVGAPEAILFGSLFTTDPADTPWVMTVGLILLGVLATLFRPLVFASVSVETARTRGVPLRTVGAIYMLLLGLAVGLSSLVTGSLLSTALLMGPAASALRLTRRIGYAMLLAPVLGIISTWLGILLAYESYYFPPTGRGWPVSFFIAGIVLVQYLLTTWWRQLRSRTRNNTPRSEETQNAPIL